MHGRRTILLALTTLACGGEVWAQNLSQAFGVFDYQRRLLTFPFGSGNCPATQQCQIAAPLTSYGFPLGGAGWEPCEGGLWVTDGRRIALVRRDCSVVCSYESPSAVFTALAFDSQGGRLYAADTGGDIQIFQVGVNQCPTFINRCRIPAPLAPLVTGLGFDPGGQGLLWAVTPTGLTAALTTGCALIPGTTFNAGCIAPGDRVTALDVYCIGDGNATAYTLLFMITERGMMILSLPGGGTVHCCQVTNLPSPPAGLIVDARFINPVQGSGTCHLAPGICPNCKPRLKVRGAPVMGSKCLQFDLLDAPNPMYLGIPPQAYGMLAGGPCSRLGVLGCPPQPKLHVPLIFTGARPFRLNQISGPAGPGIPVSVVAGRGGPPPCDGGLSAPATLWIPNIPALCGTMWCFQWLLICPYQFSGYVSDGVEFTLIPP